jgi:RND family efflux transporter MFP subunit
VLAEPTDHEVWVTSRGTVVPRTESQLVVEVPGRVVRISPDLVSGGFFEAGEVLLEIDPRDLELAVAQAELDVARSRRRLAEEEADAEVARREWETLGTGEPTPLTLREPQVAEARAQVAAAEALLERARRDLARTRVTAPFSGRVRDKRVDLGQYVQPGTPVATLYATDVAEVRLPLADGELAFVELPVAGLRDVEKRPEVELVAHFAGDRRSWTGRVVRTEGEIDPRTRMVMTVAEVREPYDPSRVVPLAIGMFVEARIRGVLLEDVLVLPREALREGDRVYALDEEDRLLVREVRVLRAERDRVVLRAEELAGARVVVSPLELVTDGMRVRDLGVDLGEASR